jgi:arylsulfatase A-like enzyme
MLGPVRPFARARAIRGGLLAGLSLAVLSLLHGCVGEGRPARPNLLWIAVDTLRADHLGAYGYDRATSPSIDRFFATAVVFDDAQATSSWTLPSFASMMTSLYPSTHGCRRFQHRLAPSFTTLAERLRDAGYYTAGIVSHVFLGSKHGLQQGFEHFDEQLVASTLKSSHAAISSPAVTEKALAFLAGRTAASDRRPWFLFVHYFDPHRLYQEHDGSSKAFGTEPVDRYDGEIAFTDEHIGRLLSELDSRGLSSDTVVVFVADHGEEFGDHGRQGHGVTLHNEVTRVPLAIRVPGGTPRRVSDTVSLVDLMPTLLDLLSVDAPDTPMAGRSLVPLLVGGRAGARDALLELEVSHYREIHPDQDAYISRGWKLIVAGSRGNVSDQTGGDAEGVRAWLYDRERDPEEQHDLSATHPEITARMRDQLESARRAAARLAANFDPAEEADLSPEDLERLRTLGYLDDASAAGHAGRPVERRPR